MHRDSAHDTILSPKSTLKCLQKRIDFEEEEKGKAKESLEESLVVTVSGGQYRQCNRAKDTGPGTHTQMHTDAHQTLT